LSVNKFFNIRKSRIFLTDCNKNLSTTYLILRRSATRPRPVGGVNPAATSSE
jgi:hypothetical protein